MMMNDEAECSGRVFLLRIMQRRIDGFVECRAVFRGRH